MKVFVVEERVYEFGERMSFVRAAFSTREFAQQYISERNSDIRAAHIDEALERGIDPEEWIKYDASSHCFSIHQLKLDL